MEKLNFMKMGGKLNPTLYEDGKIELHVEGKIVSGKPEKPGNKLQVLQKMTLQTLLTLQIAFSNSLLHLVFLMRYLVISLYSFLFRDTSYIFFKT